MFDQTLSVVRAILSFMEYVILATIIGWHGRFPQFPFEVESLVSSCASVTKS